MSEEPPEVIGTIPVNFVIVGVQKAATTTMHTMLDKHPAVAPNLKVDPHKAERKWKFAGKELHVLDDESRAWDPPDWTYYVATQTAPEQTLAVDATPSYLFWPHALERLHAYDPAIRLVASFRDPIERTFSQWRMERVRKRRPYPEFAEAIRTYNDRALFHGIPEGGNRWDVHRRSLVIRGLYAEQLERAFALFPREQWLMVTFEGFIRDHATVLDQLCDHAGIARFDRHPALVSQRTARNHEGTPPTVADIEYLADYYADDLARFPALSGVDVSAWPTARILAGTLDPAELAASFATRFKGR